MTGRTSRTKGHRYELAVVDYLRRHGFPDACTTRSTLGHSGTMQPCDVVGPPAVAIECKNVASSAWPAWLAQAQRQAGLRVPVVVRKTPGVVDVGRHATVLPWLDYTLRLDGIGPSKVKHSATCQAELWLSDGSTSVLWQSRSGRSWAVVPFSELCRASRLSA